MDENSVSLTINLLDKFFINGSNRRPAGFDDASIFSKQLPNVFSYMWANRRHQQGLSFNELEDEVYVHAASAKLSVGIASFLEFKKACSQSLLEKHLSVVLIRCLCEGIHFTDENSIVERILRSCPQEQFAVDHLLHPLDESIQSEDTSISCCLNKIGILN